MPAVWYAGPMRWTTWTCFGIGALLVACGNEVIVVGGGGGAGGRATTIDAVATTIDAVATTSSAPLPVTSVSVTSSTTSGGAGGGLAACFEEVDALLAPGDPNWTEDYAGQGRCASSAAVGTLVDCLFGPTGSGDPACAAFGISAGGIDPDAPGATDGDCTRCMLGEFGEGPPAVLHVGSSFAFLNSTGCQAQAAGSPECGVPTSQRTFCAQSGCVDCPENDFAGCVASASIDPASVCVEGLPLAPECEGLVTSEPPPGSPCSGDDFFDTATQIGTYLCGP